MTSSIGNETKVKNEEVQSVHLYSYENPPFRHFLFKNFKLENDTLGDTIPYKKVTKHQLFGNESTTTSKSNLSSDTMNTTIYRNTTTTPSTTPSTTLLFGKNDRDILGSYVRKVFPGYGDYYGIVEECYLQAISTNEESSTWFRVTYTDGDAEDLSHKELIPLLVSKHSIDPDIVQSLDAHFKVTHKTKSKQE